MTTTIKVLDFLNTFGVPVEENESSAYVDLMMDNHKCIEFEEKQYYIPENCIGYSSDDFDIYDLLVENYLI